MLRPFSFGVSRHAGGCADKCPRPHRHGSQSKIISFRRQHESTIFLTCMRRQIFLGRARLRSIAIRPKSPTSCGGAACSGNASSKCRRPGIRRGSSRRRRLFRLRRRRRLSIRGIFVPTLADPDAGGAQRSAEGAGLADQLQPVRYGSRARSRASSLTCRRKTWRIPSKACCARTMWRCGTAMTLR